jgi:SET domain-containing protein
MQTETSIQDFITAEIVEVITDITNNNRSLLSKKTFFKNEVISEFGWDIVYESPNYLTVQVEENKHIILQPSFLECINHSCAPNSFFDTTKNELICINPIAIGEEITFFYPSAEWDMDQAFECHCGSSCCIGFVQGAKHLQKEFTKQYQFTNFIQKKLNTEK